MRRYDLIDRMTNDSHDTFDTKGEAQAAADFNNEQARAVQWEVRPEGWSGANYRESLEDDTKQARAEARRMQRFIDAYAARA